MASIAGIMAGLETRLATISGLRVFEYPPDQVPVPAATVGYPERIDYDLVMGRGADRYTFPIRVFVSRVSDRTGRTRLGQYLDPTGSTSIKTAVEGDKTLGGEVDTVRVIEAFNVGIFTHGSVEYLGADFNVDVIV